MGVIQQFKSLPVSAKRLLGVGVVFALAVGLPLFVWAIVTQRFELREEASVVPTCQPRPDCLDATPHPCEITEPDQGWCPQTTATPTTTASPYPDYCSGANGSDCTYYICPVCTSKPCPRFPCLPAEGKCYNNTCIPTPEPTATPTPTPTPIAPAIGGPNGEPNSCGGTCGSKYNCGANLFCYQGFCRNPICPTDTDCACSTSSPTPKSTPKKTSSPSPTPTVTIVYLTSEPSASPSPTPTPMDSSGVSSGSPEVAGTNPNLNFLLYIAAGSFLGAIILFIINSMKNKKGLAILLLILAAIALPIFVWIAKRSNFNLNEKASDNKPTIIPTRTLPSRYSPKPVNTPTATPVAKPSTKPVQNILPPPIKVD